MPTDSIRQARKTMRKPHILIASAANEDRIASRLWKAFVADGISASLNDAGAFKDEATHFVGIIGHGTAEELPFTNQVELFRRSSFAQNEFITRVDPAATVPPVLMAKRDQDGFLERGAPGELSGIDDEKATIDRLKREILERIGARRARRPRLPAGVRPFALPIAASLALAMTGVSGWLGYEQYRAGHLQDGAQLFSARILDELETKLDKADITSAELQLASEIAGAFELEDVEVLSIDEVVRRGEFFSSLGRALERQQDRVGANRAFDSAYRMTGEQLARNPLDADLVYAHAQAAFYVGESARRAGDLAGATLGFEAYDALSRRLERLEPGVARTEAERAYAAWNLGIIALETGLLERAELLFTQALERMAAPAQDGSHASPQDVAEIMHWRANVYFQQGRFSEASQQHQAVAQFFSGLIGANPDRLSYKAGRANSLYTAAFAEVTRNRQNQGQALLDQALEQIGEVVALDRTSLRYARNQFHMRLLQARLMLWRGEAESAAVLLADAQDEFAQVNSAGLDDQRYVQWGTVHLLAAEIGNALGRYETAQAEASAAIVAYEAALQAGFARAESHLATAYFQQAEAMRGRSQTVMAERSYRESLRQLDRLAPSLVRTVDQDVRSRTYWRLDRAEEALIIRAEIERSEYRSPDYRAFWSDADASL